MRPTLCHEAILLGRILASLAPRLSEAQDGIRSGYHVSPSARGDLLDKLGRHEEASAEFARAATMTQNEREWRLLLDRAHAPT
jgi:predicted RNA polymerase sigma factor